MVILASPSKTGVTTLTAALREMGHNVFCLPESLRFHFDFWHHLFNGLLQRPDFCRLYSAHGVEARPTSDRHALTAAGPPWPVTAVTGAPAYYFTKEILQDFPAAKVILSVRDLDAWYVSFHRFYYRVWATYRTPVTFVLSHCNRMFRISSIARGLGLVADNGFWDLDRFAEPLFQPQINEVIFDGRVPSEFLWKRAYQRHVEWVRAVVPEDRLLEFDVSRDGWQKLCAFLDADHCPQKSFPWLRKAGSGYEGMEWRVMQHEALRWQIVLTVLSTVLAVLMSVCALCGKRKVD